MDGDGDGGDSGPGKRDGPAALPLTAIGVLGAGLFGLGLSVGSYGELTHLLVARGVAPETAGFGMTLFLLGQLLIVLPADLATRRWPVRLVAAGGLVLGGMGAVLPAAGTSVNVVVGSRFLLGVGQGAAFVGAMKYVGTRTTPARVAAGQGLLGALFTLGLALGIAASPTAAATTGLWAAAATAALFAAFGGVASLFLGPVERPRTLPILEYLEPLRDRVTLVLGLGNMATFGFLMVATTWYTAVFATVPGIPVTLTLVLFAAITVLGRALGGVLAGRFGDRAVVGGGLVWLAAALALFALGIETRSTPVLVTATLATALGFSVPFGPLFGLAFSTFTADAGVTLVVMLAVGNAAALLYPWLVGALLAGTQSYTGGFVVLAASVLGVFLLWAKCVGFGATHK